MINETEPCILGSEEAEVRFVPFNTTSTHYLYVCIRKMI